MRLIAATIRHYRIHQELAVAFAPRLTLIAAPNESGKSTLVEALHRALFLRHRTGGAILDGMRSRLGGHPRVELEFTAHGRRWRLAKTFRGAQGTCRLDAEDPVQSWEGDDAEAELAKLVGCAAGQREAELQQRWDHLWAFQGRSPADPLAGSGQEALAKALGSRGGGMVLGADEQRLIGRLRERVRAVFTERGGLRVDSLPGRLARECEETAQQAQRLRQEVDAHRARILELGAKRELVRRADADLAHRQPRLALLTAEADAVAGLAAEAAKARDALAQAEREQTAFETAAQRLDADRIERDAAQTAVATAQREHEAARQALTAKRQAVAEASAVAERARGERDQAADRLAIAEAQVRWHELARRQQALAQQRDRRADLLAQREQAGAALAVIPAIDAAALDRLQALETQVAQHRAALDAVVTRLRCRGGPAPVLIDGRPLAAGEEIQIADPVVIAIAGTTVEVVPGGGADVAKRRAALATAERARAESLATVGVRSCAEAADLLRRRQAATAALRSAEDRLSEVADPGEDLRRIVAEQASLRARLASFGHEPAEAVPDLDPVRAAAQRARIAATEASAAREALEQAIAGLEAAVQDVAGRMTTAELRHADLAGRVAQAERSLGDPAQVAQRRAELAAGRATAEARVQDVAARLAGRDADQLRTKCGLERQSLQALQTERDRADAQAAQLARDLGTLARDIGGELEEAEARHERAGRALASAQLQAEGERLLLQRLEAAATALRDRSEAPFLDAAGRYLRRFFGAAGQLGLDGDGDGRRLAMVDRSAAGLDRFAFDALSQGAREQVATAVRLAMAEIIAAARADRSLPVVLDESFSSTDPGRLENLGTMLAEACDAGLQVILLTCDDRVSHLGEQRIVRLRRPAPDRAPTVGASAAEATVATALAEPEAGDAQADAERLWALIPADAAGVSARTLRADLAWDKDRFDAARDRLIAQGRVEQPPGSRSLRRTGA